MYFSYLGKEEIYAAQCSFLLHGEMLTIERFVFRYMRVARSSRWAVARRSLRRARRRSDGLIITWPWLIDGRLRRWVWANTFGKLAEPIPSIVLVNANASTRPCGRCLKARLVSCLRLEDASNEASKIRRLNI